MEDDSKYIRELISEGEHQKQDFKFEISSAKKIAKTLVAFANTDGGRLLIGVKDNGRIAGIRTEEEYYMIEAAASMYCKPEIAFRSYRRVAEGKTVLEVIIQASEGKPHYALDEDKRWKAYYRFADNNYLADYILLQVWKREKRKVGTFIEYTEKEEMVLDILFRKGTLSFSLLKKELKINRRELQQILVNLICLKAIKMIFRENEILYEMMD